MADPSAEVLALAQTLADLPVPESIAAERELIDDLFGTLEAAPGTTWEPATAGGVPAVRIAPEGGAERTILYFHGGAFALASAWHYRGFLSRLALAAPARVLALDYRLAPEHPFPAAPDDSYAAYRWLLEGAGIDPATLVLAGDSCGANLALGVAQRARDDGLPAAAGVVCLSPWVDLTQSGWSYATNQGRDNWIVKEAMDEAAATYLAGADADDPLASPLRGDLSGLPPVLVQVGAGESLLAESIELAAGVARAGGAAQWQAWPHPVHVWHVWAERVPEARDALERIGAFARDVA